MLDINFKTPKDIRIDIAAKAKNLRLGLNISQKDLSELSGVSLSSIKRFEGKGYISLSSLLEVALVFERLRDFDMLFAPSAIRPSLFSPKPKKRFRAGRKKYGQNKETSA